MKRFAPPIILILLGLSILAVRHGLVAMPEVVLPQPVTAAVIVEETSARPTLSKELIGVLATASKHNVKVIDKDVVGKDRKMPEVLVPFLAAAKDKPLPQLVTRRGSDKYESAACPESEKSLLEAIK